MGVTGNKILNPAENNRALYGPAIAHPHWIPLIFKCTGELSAEEGRMSSADEAHKGGKLSEGEDAVLTARASLQETSSTVPGTQSCRDGCSLFLLLLALLHPSRG